MHINSLRFRMFRMISVSLVTTVVAWSFLPQITSSAAPMGPTRSFAPLISAATPVAMVAESVAPANGTPDPDEVVTMSFPLANSGVEGTTDLVATLMPGGGVAPLSEPQNYGALAPGGPAFPREFTFAVQGQCGSNLTATFQLTDAGMDLGTVSFTIPTTGPAGGTTVASNSAAIIIPGSGSGTSSGAPANPFPSTINVSDVMGSVTKVTVSVTGLSHTFPGDIDMLLVGPGGQKVLLMSDVGGGVDAVNTNITFDDAAAGPIGTTVLSGIFRPTNSGSTADNFPSPAPAGLYGTELSAFNGVDPNGTWRLYVVDDTSGDIGSISGGWSLSIATGGTGSGCAAQACSLNLADITKTNEPGESGAFVLYPIVPSALTSIGVTGSCGIVTAQPASGSFFAIGTTAVVVNAAPSTGSAVSSSFNVTVDDVEAPVISNVSATPSVIGPPNHKLVPVQVNYTIADNFSPGGNIAVTLSVSGNEALNGNGDGNTTSDWSILGSNDLLLRAERSGNGGGRRYTLTITATDQAGNSTTAVTHVDVAHN